MFTGIITAVGKVSAITHGQTSARITVSVEDFLGDVGLGDSISCNGTCFTVVGLHATTFSVDVMKQTLDLTTTGKLVVGSVLNLEKAARVSDRLGGHIVQGHVDGVASIVAIEPGDQWHRVDLQLPEHLMKYVQPQGSIALNGVSLTVGQLDDATNQVTVWLIPETLARTTFGRAAVGDRVNVEVDVLAKYVERIMERSKARD